MPGHSLGRTLLLLPLLLAIGGCDAEPPTARAGNGVFVVAASGGESFRILLRDAAQLEEARRLIARGERKVVSGSLARGDGGFNTGYSWHLVPESVHFPDVTIELCDGRPSDVEKDLDYWVDTVGRFCPWSARLVREEG